jgi:ABC-type nitrate/sulfonate/bicarbonate transport system substrate-binding protein
MNIGIRRVGVAMMILFLGLVAQLTYLQVVDSSHLENDPKNVRKFLSVISRPRGKIVTSEGIVLAKSVPSNDELKFQRVYTPGTAELFAHVVGFQSIQFGSVGVEAEYSSELAGKNLGVTDLGSGTHVLTQAILGTAGVDPTKSQYVAVGAGDTFIAAIQQKKIAAGMTTYPTISRLVNSGKGKILVSLLTPQDTRAALGGDYPFIGIFAKNDWVNSNKDTAQKLVNAYVKTLKYIHSHTAAEIADQMPNDYFAGDKASYVSDLNSQLSIFGTDCKMPAGGPETVQKIQQQFVSSYKGKSANLSETYTNDFADKAS